MNTYAIATILGTVVRGPEEKVYGDTQEKSLVDFRVRVQRAGRQGAVLSTDYEVSVFSQQLFPVAKSLLVGQGVQVVAQITNYPRSGKGGEVFDRLGLTALGIAPGAIQKVAPASAGGYGAASPPPSAPQGGAAGVHTSAPQGGAARAGVLPHEEDADIPF